MIHSSFHAEHLLPDPDAVIFDMDGVIIDSHPAHRRAWRLFLETMGKDVSERDLAFILDGHKRNEILRHFLGKLSDAEVVRYGELKDDFFQRAFLEVKPVSGILQFLQHLRLKGKVLGLATSASAGRTFSTLDRMGIRQHFRAIVTAGDVTQGKPDPAVYRLAHQRLHIDSGNVLVFEDAVAGIHAARHAGLRCAGVASPPLAEGLLSAGAEFVVENFTGLSLSRLKTAPPLGGSGEESLKPYID